MRVLLDPGHGGADIGASHGDFKEAAYVMDFARELKTTLVYLDLCKAEAVSLTRDAATKPSLSERADIAKRFDADVVVSLHCNASPNEDINGSIWFYRAGCKTSKAVCVEGVNRTPQSLVGHWIEPVSSNAEWRNPKTKTKEPAWPRVRNVLSVHTRPAVLIELGFVTSPMDRSKLVDDEVRTAFIHGIAMAIGSTL